MLLVPSSPRDKHPLSPASSFLSDTVGRPNKKRRISPEFSSLSEADDDDDEEERPLASRVTRQPVNKNKQNGRPAAGQRSGKQKHSMKSKAHTAPAHIAPPTAEEREEMRPNGVNGAKVKVEDKMDESQLSRLATGVTVDVAGPASAAVRYDAIQHRAVRWF